MNADKTEIDNREKDEPLWAARHNLAKLEASKKLDGEKFESYIKEIQSPGLDYCTMALMFGGNCQLFGI